MSVRGRFDFHAHREFRQAVDQALAEAGAAELEVNLAEVEYLDSSALGMLLLLKEKTQGRKVVLAGARETVRAILDVANFHRLFEIR